MRLLLGKEIANNILAELMLEVTALREQGVIPKLALLMVGTDSGSQVYLENAKRVAQKLGIDVLEQRFATDVLLQDLLTFVENLNRDRRVHGILCQLPLPVGLTGDGEQRLVSTIDPNKDVDCVHPYNLGLLAMGRARLMPCTPHAVYQLLKRNNYQLSGKRVVIVGRSNIVGRPLSLILSTKGIDATVTLCHSRTPHEELQRICKEADILVVAMGKPKFIDKNFIRPGAVVIDVGTAQLAGQIVGDVDFANVSELVAAITPVPGGVGPLTRAMLMHNVVSAAKF
ncbi:MAG: bifunctional 5,10-methylenetetrahydrofolate dehydrogenase/5,10-methenyltetrahydrofolate cyclohydrolase [Oligoflexia bacterium]|nr:bifunctional 5,10-methylenetetrahydrofolate dehydrogenase/5,10-methenyltetrahydrofolate cyclohydrolase [Oligoflexia bacterium]